MSTQTTNYALTKPATSDYYDIAIPNANMEIIDEELKANADAAAGKIPKSLATAVSQFLVSTGAGAWAIKTAAEIKTLLGLGSAAYTASTAYAAATHKARHAAGGADALTPSDIGAAPTSHSHVKANISDFPTVMTPSAHKATHATGGADALTASDIGAAKRIFGVATLAVASWAGSAAPYTYTLSDSDILSTDTPHIDRVTGTDAAAAALINTAWGLIAGYAVKPQTAAGTITFYASAKPAVAIPIMYEVVRT